ncbi:MAG: DNA polymerase IV [Dehalococcoidia bacterium]|tara:strand:- start:3159 stop:4226 length:1068 start_codon:yes stop_codon:yes gene_type:complete
MDNVDSYILHADLDAFYASVEQILNPALKHKPILVGGRPESRGVVATASYEARAFGIRSAMPMRRAVQLCPDAIIVPPNFAQYKAFSARVMAILKEYSEVLENVSLDEAYIDISNNVKIPSDALNIGLEIKNQVKLETGLIISIGISSNKTTSKIASDLNKPDGLVFIPLGQELKLTSHLNVNKIPGIGPKSTQKLNQLGINTIGQLCAQPTDFFTRIFGSQGNKIQWKSSGNYKERLQTVRNPKAISTETTFREDIIDKSSITEELHQLTSKLASNAIDKSIKGKTIRIKVRFEDFTTHTSQTTLVSPTNELEILREASLYLLDRILVQPRPIRLLGISLSNFDNEPSIQLTLL